MEIGNLPNKEFKVMIKIIVKELRRRLDEQSEKLEVFNKLENIKKNHTEMQNTIIEKKNTLEGIDSKLDDTKKTDQQVRRQSGRNHSS